MFVPWPEQTGGVRLWYDGQRHVHETTVSVRCGLDHADATSAIHRWAVELELRGGAVVDDFGWLDARTNRWTWLDLDKVRSSGWVASVMDLADRLDGPRPINASPAAVFVHQFLDGAAVETRLYRSDRGKRLGGRITVETTDSDDEFGLRLAFQTTRSDATEALVQACAEVLESQGGIIMHGLSLAWDRESGSGLLRWAASGGDLSPSLAQALESNLVDWDETWHRVDSGPPLEHVELRVPDASRP